MIYLFYPSKIIGGAELLIMSTALLLENNGAEVAIIDIEDGWVSSNINIKIKKKYIRVGEKYKLEDEDFLITTANFLYDVDDYFDNSSARVLFWAVQPYNIILQIPSLLKKIPFFEKNYILLKKNVHIDNLKYIIKKKSLVAMDGACDDVLKNNYNIRYVDFLPVFINEDKFINNYVFKNREYLNITWLGRVDLDFKIHILKKVIIDCNNVSKLLDKKIVFNVIGNGPGLDGLKLFVENNIEIEVNFLLQKTGEELDLLFSDTDLGVAMGTSSIDMSSKGIPTLLLDFSYTEVEDYKYRWIFDSETNCLGRDINTISVQEINLMSTLEEVIDELNSNYLEISKSCFNYAHDNHSSNSINYKIESLINNSLLTVNDIYGYRNTKPFWKNLKNFVRKLGN